MSSFQPGLFAGGDEVDQIRDNLDLERWFRLLKGHERRIHGHKHAGVRIVQEGSTKALALDAHRAHRGLFTVDDLLLSFGTHARMPTPSDERRIMRKPDPKPNDPNCWSSWNADIEPVLAVFRAFNGQKRARTEQGCFVSFRPALSKTWRPTGTIRRSIQCPTAGQPTPTSDSGNLTCWTGLRLLPAHDAYLRSSLSPFLHP